MVLKVGSGDIDDLSTLNVLDEESLLRELRARYKKGIIYVIEFAKVHKKEKNVRSICLRLRLTLAMFSSQSIRLNNWIFMKNRFEEEENNEIMTIDFFI